MKKSQRPYAGNWSEDFLNKYRTTRSWTPDAIVTFNGESTLPGCPTCRNKIDFSRFINSVNTGGGVDGSNSCDIQLKIPWAYGDSVYKDGKFILTTGIEVFVYYRGFFQVKELALSIDNVELENGEILSAPDAETRPYYPVYHGVIESVSVDPSDGAYSVSIGTRNMLSFWDNQQINTVQGYFAADPTMSRGSNNLRGHVYTNMTPHQIIYDLFLDAGGSAEGTGFALSKTSNVKAKTSTGQQQYSLHLRYLQERFKNGMYGLRMFGASGRMYTSLETQIIANEVTLRDTSSGKKKRKQDAEFRDVIKEQKKPYATPKSKSIAYSRLVKAGMIAYEFDNATDGRVQRRIDAQLLTQITEGDTSGDSVLSKKPFVNDLGNLANVPFWESSLESKKSIASQVCDATGYEFYQDMDGDLVFKPPMYNMDTSNDRVYNIFREDIISISYSHSEPTATYVTCKGSHFRNLIGAAPDGEWGVKGVYVDYALVAKYGWRGHEFDSSYYNNARQAYYAAAVELDKQNKATEGCDITIPLRPEIKPGYPVWVEENDCYYYVESVQHSFSFGGSCTTGLTLVCQRKKFIPPGDRNVKYSEDPARAVDLGRTELAEKYIYKRYDRQDETPINRQSTEENIAYSKIVGFPNVVMALDPTNADPTMLMYDPDFQNIGRAGTEERRQYLRMIVNEGIRLGVLSTNPNDPSATMTDGPWALYRPNSDGVAEWVPLGVEPSTTDVVLRKRTKSGYVALFTRSGKTRTKKSSRDSSLGNYNIAGINALDAISEQVRREGEKAEKAHGRATTAAKAAQTDLQDREEVASRIREAVNGTSVEGGNPTATILDLITVVQSKLGRGEGTSPLQNLISALSDRKASFAPKAKGYFRYYSSSHPDPEHQGPDLIEYQHDRNNNRPTLIFNQNTPDQTSNHTVLSAGDGDIVRFDHTQRPTRGLFTKTMYSNGVEYVPTKDILALSFQVTGNYSVVKVAGPKLKVSYVWEQTGQPLGCEYWNSVLKTMRTELLRKLPKRNPLSKPLNFIYTALKSELKSFLLPLDYQPIKVSDWDTSESNTYFTSNTYEVVPEDDTPLEVVVSEGMSNNRGKIASYLAQAIVYKIRSEAKAKYSEIYADSFRSLSIEEKNQKTLEHGAFVNDFFLVAPVQSKVVEQERYGIKIGKKQKTITPIFPISDENGYEVFGAYQYGRGLKVARGTIFDALLKQDPFKVWTQQTMTEAIKALDRSRSPQEFNEKKRELFLLSLRDMDPQSKERIAIGLGLDAAIGKESQIDENAIVNGLMTASDEQVISNVPLQLAQIHPTEDGNEACQCRVQSTDALLLEGSLNLDNFLEIENPLLRSVRNQTEEKAALWQEHQVALRGENIPSSTGGFATSTSFGEGFDFNNRSDSRLIQAIEQNTNPFTSAVENTQTGIEVLSDQAKQLIAKNERK